MPAALPCWDCGQDTLAERACPECGKLQPPPDTSWFSTFGLPERFTLEPGELEARYHALARTLHPDRYMRRTPEERTYATAHTERLNLAHETLVDPLARARYLLGLHDVGLPAGQLPRELAMRYFELQGPIIEMRMTEGAERARHVALVQAFRAEVAAAITEAVDAVRTLGAEADRLRDQDEAAWRERVAAIAAALSRHAYLDAMRRDLDQRLADAGAP